VDLYLRIHPRVVADSSFAQRAAALPNLAGFAYLGIERASFERAFQSSGVGSVGMWFGGVPVKAGQLVGNAAPSTARGAAQGARDVGFAAINSNGLLDPSFTYLQMRDYVEDGPASVEAFLRLSPVLWPVIDPDLSTDAAIELTQSTLFTWPILNDLRKRKTLTRAQWRTVGDNQKRIYRRRLLARTGRAPADNTEPPFEFNNHDSLNVFQLEAVTEFYANFDDPWKPGAEPRDPSDPKYSYVDFIDPAGAAAVVSSDDQKTLRLDGNPDLSHVRCGVDTIRLEADTRNSMNGGKIYLIKKVETKQIGGIVVPLVTLDAAPTFTGTSAWQINLRPWIVLIDPFGARERSGARLSGTAAKVLQGSKAIKVEDGVDLSRVNRSLPAAEGDWGSGPFDTIYFSSDRATASNRPAHTYRIDTVDPVNHTITVLGGPPDFDGGTSGWHIPAGVSGEPPPLVYNVGPSSPPGSPSCHGNDHYDGVVHVIHHGRVEGAIRFSSYTSRKHVSRDLNLASIRGNRRYHVTSYLSPGAGDGPLYRNYCFLLWTFGGPAKSGGELSQGSADNLEARFYFGNPVVAGNQSFIELHLGNSNSPTRGNGSDGCLVSPDYPLLRQLLVRLALEDAREAWPLAALPQYRTLANASHERAKEIKISGQLPDSSWNDKLVCTLWLIRPDERPLNS
jgi:hypothetical protein